MTGLCWYTGRQVNYPGHMTVTATPVPRLTSRPGRPVLVVGALSELRGPESGIVEAPHRIVWLPAEDRRFDLGDGYDRVHLYEVVLREAARFQELCTLLNEGLLRRMWRDLHLPRGVRAAWEQRHPELAARRLAARAA